MALCPCGSGLIFEKCCDPYISGVSDPLTAEALMRARYSAYATGINDYIDKTVHPEKRDASGNTMSGETVSWLGLTILSTRDGKETDDHGVVEFEARFNIMGKQSFLREYSEFKKKDGRWFYYDGNMIEDNKTQVRSNKTGRNEPCPCGSGVKYKKCCGK
ncbi:MAG TPA: hypothetical protein ENG78_06420 [Acidiferrobacteraceae bacterium]|nr:hypothetical protein [Acidiferrobacteraceae bacterium]HEX20435.1 hypothetical protein [Acidiferrobacteraceae bacterium]